LIFKKNKGKIMNEQIKYYEDKLNYELDSSDLYQMIINNKKIIVIDTRTEEYYNISHIPNSINIPHRTMNKKITKDLDKSYLYITYCDGIGCNASTKGALNMSKLDFHVKELLGGLDWWIRDGYETHGENVQSKYKISCGC
jgi:rhodanese-related sulfurtransferase